MQKQVGFLEFSLVFAFPEILVNFAKNTLFLVKFYPQWQFGQNLEEVFSFECRSIAPSPENETLVRTRHFEFWLL